MLMLCLSPQEESVEMSNAADRILGRPSHGVIIMCRRCAPSCNSHRGTTLLEQEVEEERENDGAPAIE